MKMVLYFLPLLVIACTLTAQSTAVDSLPLAQQTNPATLTPTPVPQLLGLCHVKTGFEAGTLNLRTCGGTYCPNITLLHEGETLSQTEIQAIDGWLEVRTANGLQGWANSKYLDCEETK